MIAFATPSISPATSLSSSDRSFSSDFSVDGNFDFRGNQDECPSDSSQDEINNMTEGLKQNLKTNGPVSRVHSSNIMMEISNKRNHGDRWRDVEISEADHQDAHRDSDQEHEDENIQIEAQIWEPPEPENPEDELEGGVAGVDDDDDDECCDGSEWSKSSILRDSKDENNKSLTLKEKNQREMQQVISSKFKAVVSQLLKSVGVSLSTKDGENWVDIVIALSWEAASLLKPVVNDGKPIDPTAYIKVKCIATGSRCQSQVFRGLVFKKHAAHKHMPTKYENPRILLLRGVLGQSSSGLSSFKSMEQEKDYVRPVVDMMEACHPNVILVEKSASRDVQESILSKGITLVYDMKLHRLERIARCTGSPIVSLDSLSSQKLKQCGSFRIEKFVEEHNAGGEGGKKPSKTLMFLEGCPTRLGFTILLKGSHCDELKRVKEVVQYAFVLAYHLILETSFLVDQQTMFSTIPFTGAEQPAEMKSPLLRTYKPSGSPVDESSAESAFNVADIPISNGFHERTSFANGKTEAAEADTWQWDQDSVFSYEPYNPAIFAGFSSLSASIKKIIEKRFRTGSLSAYFGLVQDQEVVPVSVVSDGSDNCNSELIRDSAEDTAAKDAKEQPLLLGSEVSTKMVDGSRVQTKKDIETALESQSILVLVSRRNAFKGIICEQSHFSHIMFYKNFDVPLGIFLRDMFNQGSLCKTCEELPEAHLYYYAHHNKQLTIQIKRLPLGKGLPGETKGKLWMWSCCGKCRTKDGTLRSTKRVLISTAARSLSFGKFLELGFSQQSLPSRLSSCGHSLDTDFLHFFGLGSMVAIFRYSWVTTYTVALPLPRLEVGSSIKTGWLEKEFNDVFTKTISLFEEVASSLKQLRSEFTNSSPSHPGLLEGLSDIEKMLKEEHSQFEENMKNAFDKTKNPDDVPHKLLGLNRIRWELLLQAFVWDCRLRSLSLPVPTRPPNGESEKDEQGGKAKLDSSLCHLSDAPVEGNEIASKEIPINGTSVQGHGKNHQTEVSNIPKDNIQRCGVPNFTTTSLINHHFESHPADSFQSANYQQVDKVTPMPRQHRHSEAAVCNGSAMLGWKTSNEWFWLPFTEVQSLRIEDLERGYLSKSETVNSSTQENPTTMHQIIIEEGSRLHIPLGDNHLVVSDYEDELSSLIACALALLDDQPTSGESGNMESRNESRMLVTRCKHASLEGFLNTDTLEMKHNLPCEDQRFPSFDGLSLLESLTPPEGLRREVSFGSAKLLGKCKYSVICLYADHFRDLRRRCCSSELDYIASLSRCKLWDAKGGKSKSVFAKTLDDRFIIKEIKKTEYESFVKFALEYFKYMNDSYDSGNQTCLAKVLGIYQVVTRQPKTGKEIKYDLMVMENLNFGRKIIRQYDLKGALHARYTNSADGAEDVLLDQNFVNDMNNSPQYISNTSKRILHRAVWNDTSFLNSINVMDYSLLVGVDAEKRELVCGIIDYLRQYTWDKQLETWVKSSLVVPKNVLPTIISPKEYKKRFRKFLSTHFLCVPDNWCTKEPRIGSNSPASGVERNKPEKQR